MKSEFIVAQTADGSEKTVTARLLGRKLHLLRMETPDAGPIVVTEQRRDTTGWYEILAVGKKCKYFGQEHVGKAVWLKENPIGKRTWCWRVGPNERVVREEWFEEPHGPPLAVVG